MIFKYIFIYVSLILLANNCLFTEACKKSNSGENIESKFLIREHNFYLPKVYVNNLLIRSLRDLKLSAYFPDRRTSRNNELQIPRSLTLPINIYLSPSFRKKMSKVNKDPDFTQLNYYRNVYLTSFGVGLNIKSYGGKK